MFQQILVIPLLNALVVVYQILPVRDLGLAVIIIVILIRVVLSPLFLKAAATQIRMQKIQPEVQELQRRLKGNKEVQTKAILQLYRDHKLNPFSGMFILLVQLPVLIALYQVFQKSVRQDEFAELVYGFLANPGPISHFFLGSIDLAKPFIPLALIAAAVQFFQTRMITPAMTKDMHKEHSMQTAIARQMLYIGPVMTLAILWGMPSVIALYWSVTSLWSIGEQYFILRKSSQKQ